MPSLASKRSTDSFGMISYSVVLTISAASGSLAQRLELAVLAHARRIARQKMQIRAVALQHLRQIAVDGWHGSSQAVSRARARGAPAMSVTKRWNWRLSDA